MQSILSVAQVTNVAAGDGFINKEITPFLSIGMGIAQMYISKKAHDYNPDGTPASVAYLTEKEMTELNKSFEDMK